MLYLRFAILALAIVLLGGSAFVQGVYSGWINGLNACGNACGSISIGDGSFALMVLLGSQMNLNWCVLALTISLPFSRLPKISLILSLILSLLAIGGTQRILQMSHSQFIDDGKYFDVARQLAWL